MNGSHGPQSGPLEYLNEHRELSGFKFHSCHTHVVSQQDFPMGDSIEIPSCYHVLVSMFRQQTAGNRNINQFGGPQDENTKAETVC